MSVAVALAACEQRPTEPSIAPAFNGVQNVTLRFVVFDGDVGTSTDLGARVPGAAVWLYGLAPCLDEQSAPVGTEVLCRIVNDNMTGDQAPATGVIEVSVPAADYGAMIKAIPVPAQNLLYVAPVPPLNGLTPVPFPFAPVTYVGGGFDIASLSSESEAGWVCATGPNVLTTTTDLPIDATNVDGTLDLPADIRACDFTLLDINLAGGQPGDALYGVIKAGVSLLGEGDNLQLGVERGILGFVAIGQNGSSPAIATASPIAMNALNGETTFTLVCPVGANFAVELFQTVNDGTNRVASLLLPEGCDPNASVTLLVETARCAIENDTDTGATFGAATWGYGFDRGDIANNEPAKTLNTTTASAQFSVALDGKYSVTFTTDKSQGGTLKSTAEFTCAGGNCTAGAVKHTGAGNTQSLGLYFTPDPDNAGHVIVEAVLAGIPAHDELLWSAKGPAGATLPRPSNANFKSSAYPFRQAPINGTCIGDSNDGTWSVRGI